MSSDKQGIKYDLEERCMLFGENVIVFLKTIPRGHLRDQLSKQLIRSATSVGANYMEANQASSKKDFRNKITICRKESSESKYWFRMLKNLYPECSDEATVLSQEAHELTLIFSKIVRSCDGLGS